MGRKAASGRDAPVRRGPSTGLRAALFPVAFLLVPAGTALVRALRLLVVLLPDGPTWLGLPAPVGAFVLGALLFAGAFVAVRLPARAYVAVHEATHALFGLLGGARVSRLRVGEEQGSVEVSRPTLLNLLAPYFFPLPCAAVLLLFGLVSLAVPMAGRPAGAVAALLAGVAWGFHACYTVNALFQRQTDLEAGGLFFSLVLVALLNLLFLWAALVALTPARLGPSLSRLGGLAADSYLWYLDLVCGR